MSNANGPSLTFNVTIVSNPPANGTSLSVTGCGKIPSDIINKIIFDVLFIDPDTHDLIAEPYWKYACSKYEYSIKANSNFNINAPYGLVSDNLPNRYAIAVGISEDESRIQLVHSLFLINH